MGNYMTTNNRTRSALILAAVALMLIVQSVAAKEIPTQLPDPDTKPPVTNKPVKVYILSGQSNMVGIGQISGGSRRWGKQFLDPVVSIYPGEYSSTADYDKMTPIETKPLPAFGGVQPTRFPGGGTAVVRGSIKMPTSGVYKFNAGYSNSSYNIMEVDGVEVYRKEVGKEAVHAEFKFTAGKKYPFKITFLTKAANGLGWVWRTDIPGTLDTVVKTDKKFPHLVDDKGNWTVRNDVWYKGVVTATANKWLTVGCGSGAGTIGPELQFGHIMGYYHDEPVIIIKASQGNRSLGWDILPPGSERFTFDGRTYAGYKDTPSSWIEGEPKKPVNWYAGKQYDDFVAGIHDVLDNFATHFPQYKDQGYEIAGFVWWQGHKDGNPAHASRYEFNLVNLIKAYRTEFKAPKAPFVIGTIGFDGWKMAGPHLTVANAQLAVSGDKGKYPEFAGNVLTVEIRDFWIDETLSPRNQGYHYNQNAETYVLVGDALGRGMCQLLGDTTTRRRRIR
jgi:alpha-galactosidase